MPIHQVSDENLHKVESFFVRRAKETGSTRIEATVIEVAEGASVALATAHKAIQALQKNKTITVIKPKSRRFPINYIYNKEIIDFEAAENKDEQIAYLQALVAQLQQDNKDLKEQIGELRAENNNLRNNTRITQ